MRNYDLLLSVCCQRVALPVEECDAVFTKDPAAFVSTLYSHTSMFNVLGFPAATVPCGFIDWLPVRLQIVGWPRREELIFRAANAFQKAFLAMNDRRCPSAGPVS